MEPAVSIVIPTYKEEKYIGDAIDNLKKQTSWPWAEIVIADYDPDKTGDTVNAILRSCDEETLKKIVHVPVLKNGIGFARHIGCLAARGRFIVTFDADARFAQLNGIDAMIRPLMGGYYLLTHCMNCIKSEELVTSKIREANQMYVWRNTVINPLAPVLIFEQGMTFTRDGYLAAGGFPDVIVGEGPILGLQYILKFGAARLLQMENVWVESSGRRASAGNGGVILDLNYNNAYR